MQSLGGLGPEVLMVLLGQGHSPAIVRGRGKRKAAASGIHGEVLSAVDVNGDVRLAAWQG